jgi:hypothetical protein
MTPLKNSETEFSNMLLDADVVSVDEGFEQLHQHTVTCGFLCRVSEIPKKQ